MQIRFDSCKVRRLALALVNVANSPFRSTLTRPITYNLIVTFRPFKLHHFKTFSSGEISCFLVSWQKDNQDLNSVQKTESVCKRLALRRRVISAKGFDAGWFSIGQDDQNVWKLWPVPSLRSEKLVVGGYQCLVGAGRFVTLVGYFLNRLMKCILGKQRLVCKRAAHFCLAIKQDQANMCRILTDIQATNELSNEALQELVVRLRQALSPVHQDCHVQSLRVFTGTGCWKNLQSLSSVRLRCNILCFRCLCFDLTQDPPRGNIWRKYFTSLPN